jgi:hypothetical protein
LDNYDLPDGDAYLGRNFLEFLDVNNKEGYSKACGKENKYQAKIYKIVLNLSHSIF